MKWSWKIGRLAGIDVYLHTTFVLLLAWVGASFYLERHRWGDVFSGLVFIACLFGIIVLHELGHALTARRFGIATRDITLLPIGGVARLERMPEDPKQELLVALAGPAVNLVLAGALLFAVPLAATVAAPETLTLVGGSLLSKLFWVNLVLALFNLLPAFPMDGGRVLRALLAIRLDYVRATQIAATVGQMMAFVFGFVGLFTNPFLVFIAFFVWMGASSEAGMVQLRSSIAGIPVARAMITEFHAVDRRSLLRSVAELVLAGFQQDFPVLDGGRLVGVLTRDALMRAIAAEGLEGEVGEAMSGEFETTHPGEMLESAMARLKGSECRCLPVMREERLVGLLTMENIGELLMVQAAVRGESPRRAVIGA